MSTLQRAIEIATEAHKGQFDKSGKDYIGHPLRVMEMGKTEEEKIVGVLHDVIEDTDWTFETLAEEGFSKEVIDALRCVTKLSENENYDDFIERIKKNPLAVAVKINDLSVAAIFFLKTQPAFRCLNHFYAKLLLLSAYLPAEAVGGVGKDTKDK